MGNFTKFETENTNNISNTSSTVTATFTSTTASTTSTTTNTTSATNIIVNNINDIITTPTITNTTLSSTHNSDLNPNNIYNVKNNSNASNIKNTNTCTKNSISKYDQISCVNTIRKPWKFVYQNIQSLISDNSRIKIDYFNEYIVDNKIALFNFTETWLTDTIKEEAKINGYNVFRGDRNEIKQGGVAIYLHNSTDGQIISSYSKNKCDMVAIKVKSLNILNIV